MEDKTVRLASLWDSTWARKVIKVLVVWTQIANRNIKPLVTSKLQRRRKVSLLFRHRNNNKPQIPNMKKPKSQLLTGDLATSQSLLQSLKRKKRRLWRCNKLRWWCNLNKIAWLRACRCTTPAIINRQRLKTPKCLSMRSAELTKERGRLKPILLDNTTQTNKNEAKIKVN